MAYIAEALQQRSKKDNGGGSSTNGVSAIAGDNGKLDPKY